MDGDEEHHQRDGFLIRDSLRLESVAELGFKKCQRAGRKRAWLYPPGVEGALLLQLPVPEDVTRGRNCIDGASQCLGGAIFVRVHGGDQRFLTNLGWDWR